MMNVAIDVNAKLAITGTYDHAIGLALEEVFVFLGPLVFLHMTVIFLVDLEIKAIIRYSNSNISKIQKP